MWSGSVEETELQSACGGARNEPLTTTRGANNDFSHGAPQRLEAPLPKKGEVERFGTSSEPM